MSTEYLCARCRKCFFGQPLKRYWVDKDTTPTNKHGNIFEFCEKCAVEYDIEYYRLVRSFVHEDKDLTELPTKSVRVIEKGNRFYSVDEK